MSRFYLISGIILCLLAAYGNTIGWEIMNFNHWSRLGPTAPGVYHK